MNVTVVCDPFNRFQTFTQLLRGLLSPCIAGVPVTFLNIETHFLASAFPNLATRSEVAYLLGVLLLPFLSWQGVPRTAQQRQLPPAAICAQVLQIPPYLSTFLSLLSFPLWFVHFANTSIHMLKYMQMLTTVHLCRHRFCPSYFEACVFRRGFLFSVWWLVLGVLLANSRPTPFTAQVTGQAWQCARESKWRGVRRIGQGWMWGSHSPPVCLGLFCRWAYSAQCQRLKPNLDQTNEFVCSLDCEDSWDDR